MKLKPRSRSRRSKIMIGLALTSLVLLAITFYWVGTAQYVGFSRVSTTPTPQSTPTAQSTTTTAHMHHTAIAELRPQDTVDAFAKSPVQHAADPCANVVHYLTARHYGGLNNIRARLINQVVLASWLNAGLVLPTVTVHEPIKGVAHDERPFGALFDKNYFVQELRAAGFCVVEQVPVSDQAECRKVIKWPATENDNGLGYFHGKPFTDRAEFMKGFNRHFGAQMEFPDSCKKRTVVHNTASPLYTILSYSPRVCMNYWQCQLGVRALRPNPEVAALVYKMKSYLARQTTPLVVMHVRTWSCNPFTTEMMESLMDVLYDSMIPDGATLYLSSAPLDQPVMELLSSRYSVLTKDRVTTALDLGLEAEAIPYQAKAFVDYELGVASDFFVGSVDTLSNVFRGIGGSSFDSFIFVERLMANRPYIPFLRRELHNGKGKACHFWSPLKPFLQIKYPEEGMWNIGPVRIQEASARRAKIISDMDTQFEVNPGK